MGITFGDHLIDSGYREITPEQEREIEAQEDRRQKAKDDSDDASAALEAWIKTLPWEALNVEKAAFMSGFLAGRENYNGV